jgi:hypothetical protein
MPESGEHKPGWSRPPRDARMESSPPAGFDEVALPATPTARPAAPSRTPGSRPSARPVTGARSSLRPGVSARPSSRPSFDRSVTLEAEIERLKAARTEDADVTAAMLVRLAEAERMRLAAQTRCSELEAELVQMRQRAAAAEARFEGSRMTMTSALGMLEEMEHREEMAASIRSRAFAQTRAALQGQGRTAPPPPESPFDAAWELPSGEDEPTRSR